jgi:tRNA 2-thiouridine synthesizing protein E
MGYEVNGVELETDEEGYLLEASFDDDVPPVIAAAEGITLTEGHWEVIRYLRDKFKEDGHTPNFRTFQKEFQEINPQADSKYLYSLFPEMPAKQGVKVAGLPKPFGKGGY